MIVGKVTGINGQNNKIEFELDIDKVRHIRRCLKHYEHIHPTDDEDDLTNVLIKEFNRFGRSRRTRSGSFNKKKYYFKNESGVEKKCVECGRKNKLTVDHIVPRSVLGKKADKVTNFQYLCKDCHDLKNYKKILERKLDEIVKLNNRIKKI